MNLTRAAFPLTALALASLLAACGNDDAQFNELPQGVTQLSATTYGATSVSTGATAAAQDLLTGGIGKTGLGAATAPVYADAANPSAAELRRNALYANYRGLVDPSVNGGYGRLYGPNIDLNGADTLGEGLVPGREYVGVLDDGSGGKNVPMAVQIPASFNRDMPCIVVAPSSGSRGVYGALAAGEWGLKRGCAVVLTDAGRQTVDDALFDLVAREHDLLATLPDESQAELAFLLRSLVREFGD